MTHLEQVTVYTKQSCVQCNAQKRLLDREGIHYREVNLDLAENGAELLAGLRERGFLSAPVVDTNVGLAWAGFQPEMTRSLAERVKARLSA